MSGEGLSQNNLTNALKTQYDAAHQHTSTSHFDGQFGNLTNVPANVTALENATNPVFVDTTYEVKDGELSQNNFTDGNVATLGSALQTHQDITLLAVKTEVTTEIATAVSGLVDSAPETLDTLNELAAALGDDANLATTLTNSIATKLDDPTLADGTWNLVVSGGGTVKTWTMHSGVAPTVKDIVSADVETTPAVDGRVTIDMSAAEGNSTTGTLERSSFVFNTNKYTTNVGTADDARKTLRIFSRGSAEAGYGFNDFAGSDFDAYQNWDAANDPFDTEATLDALEAQFQVGAFSVDQSGTESTDAQFQMTFTKTSATEGFFAVAGTDLTATVTTEGLGITGATVAAVPAVFTEQIGATVVLNNNDTVRWTDNDGTVLVYIYIGAGVTFTAGEATLPPTVSNTDFRLI